MISIVDYGAGNLGSIANMLRKLGYPAIITSNPEDIKKAEKLILPGVGNFDYGMSKLRESGLVEILNQKVLEDKIPILGICLGAQLMTKKSEEGKELADELADVLWVLLCIANQTGIDLTDALQKNMDKKTTRDATRHQQNEKLK